MSVDTCYRGAECWTSHHSCERNIPPPRESCKPDFLITLVTSYCLPLNCRGYCVAYKIQRAGYNVGISSRKITANFMNSEQTKEGRRSVLCPETRSEYVLSCFLFVPCTVHQLKFVIGSLYVFPVCSYSCDNEIYLTVSNLCCLNLYFYQAV